MQLTAKQEAGLKMAVTRANLGMRYTVIAGYAGSGKSTLVKYIVDALGCNDDNTAYVAYTGKASQVLKSKGCKNAITAHKLLYYARKDKYGNFIFKPRERLEQDYKLIVVDEVSMLPEEMWYQLLSHGVYVLAMGDPGQLPAVQSKSAPILDKPHVFLDEIMRQAQESEIIRLSMHIREGKDFRSFPAAKEQVCIIPHKYMFSQADEDLSFMHASQIICGTNAERNRINQRVRELQGRGPIPEIGDKIIGLDNHWDVVSEQENALTNGLIGTIKNYHIENQIYPNNDVRWKGYPETPIMYTDIEIEDGDMFYNIPVDYTCVITGNPLLTPEQETKLEKYNKSLLIRESKSNYFNASRYIKQVPYHFNYSYSITCWKSQGSEYANVLGYDAGWVKKKMPDQYQKYLYTLTTRASQKLILVGD